MAISDLFSLTGRIAFVTGGSRGIGRMIAQGFVEQKARVYIRSRKAAACQAVASELSSNGRTCISLPADISTVDGCRLLADAYRSREDRLDILVNNAGAAWLAPFEAFPEKGWDKVLDLNLKSPFFLTQALTDLLETGASPDRYAKVINIASIDGLRPNPDETYSYQASKAALIHLTRRMAARFIPHHICINSIAPGAFASDMNTVARDDAERLGRRIPAGRIGRDEDMQGAAVYLASRAGDYVVGTTLTVDGGVTFAHADL